MINNNNKSKIFLPICILIACFSLFSLIANTEAPAIVVALTYYKQSYASVSDLPIARGMVNLVISFFVFSIIVKLGYKKSLASGLVIIALVCCIFPFLNDFLGLIVLFALIGAVFGVVKICVYTLATAITETRTQLVRVINLLEGFFMLALVLSYWTFGYFAETGKGWIQIYWLFAGISFVVISTLCFLKIDESKVRQGQHKSISEYKKMPLILKTPLPLIFLIAGAFYSGVDGIMFTWLPTFYKTGLNIEISKSIDIAAFIAAFYGIGRLISVALLKKVKWNVYLMITTTVSIIFIIALIFMFHSSHIQETSWADIPLVAYLLPFLGLFIGPIGPIISSITLESVQKKNSGAMMLLITVFGATGAMACQKITGVMFGDLGPIHALPYFLLLFSIVWLAVLFFNIFIKKIDIFIGRISKINLDL